MLRAYRLEEHTMDKIEYNVDMKAEELIDLIKVSVGDKILDQADKIPYALSIGTGSGGLMKIMRSSTVHHSDETNKVDMDGSKVILEYIRSFDSELLTPVRYRGATLTSYSIVVMWATEPILMLKPVYNK